MPDNFNQSIPANISKAIARSLDPFIHSYLAVSKNAALSPQRIGVPQKKIEIIPPIIDINRFHPGIDGTKTKENLGINSSSPLLLFVGSTKPVKNLETVLCAFSVVSQEMPEARLVITARAEPQGP